MEDLERRLDPAAFVRLSRTTSLGLGDDGHLTIHGEMGRVSQRGPSTRGRNRTYPEIKRVSVDLTK